MSNSNNNLNTRALIIRPVLKSAHHDSERHLIINQYRLEEAIGLANSIKFTVIDAVMVSFAEFKPSTLIGSGKIDELKTIIADKELDLIIMDAKLSPVQQRNLEKEWQVKVIDRTGLILEIFSQRARTAEGKLQVELALLEYQKSRLVRSWTHLERQRGGMGKTGGPGETQIESDRREIREEITKIKTQLERVVKTRELHRKSRKEVPYPIVALVGYTNAGKSTIFNKITGSNVEAVDKLFATLDPTMRIVELPSKRKVILSDTVGFISELPTELVAAFRATLEEVLAADLLLHIRDYSSSETEMQKIDVLTVLESLHVDEKLLECQIEVLNKIDMLEDNNELILHYKENPNVAAISASKNINIDELLVKIDRKLGKDDLEKKFKIKYEDGKLLSFLYDNAEIIARSDKKNYIEMQTRISENNYNKFLKLQRSI